MELQELQSALQMHSYHSFVTLHAEAIYSSHNVFYQIMISSTALSYNNLYTGERPALSARPLISDSASKHAAATASASRNSM